MSRALGQRCCLRAYSSFADFVKAVHVKKILTLSVTKLAVFDRGRRVARDRYSHSSCALLQPPDSDRHG